MQYLRTNWPSLIVVASGFAIALALALAPLNFLLANTVPDDSFYYFQIARNIVNGAGSTFDGINLTNGYHPLWMLLLLPIYAYFSAPIVMDVAPIHAALALGAVFSAAFCLVLLAVLSRYTSSPWIRAIAIAAWVFNPYNIYAMSDGLETALSMLFIGTFILVALRYRERRTMYALVLVGIVAGLMMLARLDNVFYFVMFLAWLLYEQGLRASIRPILSVGIVASVVVAPWLLLNYWMFGMFFTSASAAYTIVNHRIIYQDNGYSLFQQLKAVVYMTDFSLRRFVLPSLGAPSVFLMILGVAIGWMIFVGQKFRDTLRSIPLEFFIAAGWALGFAANASIRWSPREWYFIAFNLFVVITLAWLLEKMRQNNVLRAGPAVIAVLFVASLYYISWSRDLENRYYTSVPILNTTLWMNENLESDAILGAFNAGITGYFSTHRLINLDGLVNNAAYEAIRDKEVWEYIESEGIDYLSDNAASIDYRMKSSLGIQNVRERLEPVYEPKQGASVYKIK